MNNQKQDFKDWVSSQSIDEGERNCTVVRIVAEGLGQGFSQEFLQEVIVDYCSDSGLPVSEAFSILDRHQKKHQVNPFDANHAKQSDNTSWGDITRAFLNKYYVEDGMCTLKNWNGDFYSYEDKVYRRLQIDEIKSKIGQFVLNDRPDLRKKKPSVAQREVFESLYAYTIIPFKEDMPFYSRGISKMNSSLKSQKKFNYLRLINGVLDLSRVSDIELRPHTMNLFSTIKLSYDFDKDRDCPKWKKFLRETFSEKEVIDMVQEWFGYNLANHNKHQKFLLCVGNGANGKSVFLKVLSLMIGKGNYASVGLENFDPKRTFALSCLQGKMANIVNDLNEIKKTGEGLLKQFVAGEPITVERKYRDHFEMMPIAKLTMATNILPRFMDRSDGVWRRLILLSFRNQIMDESKQDKNLMSDEWWIKSKELPGILNWAIEGLIRLEERGKFSLPSSIRNDIQAYKDSSNAAVLFLKAFVEEDSKFETNGFPTSWLYSDYKLHCESNGYRPLNSQNFATEVKNLFPDARVSDDVKFFFDPSVRECAPVSTRVWQGICKMRSVGSVHDPII